MIVLESTPGTFTEVTKDLAEGENVIPFGNFAIWNDDELAAHNCFRIEFPATPDGKTLASYTVARVDGVVQIVPVWADIPAEVLQARLQSSIVSAVQSRLDTFAQTRGYDSILSACTYAASTVTQFATEGQYCINQRDATWAALYQMLAEVQAGTRPMPSGYADIEPDLPVLTWP